VKLTKSRAERISLGRSFAAVILCVSFPFYSCEFYAFLFTPPAPLNPILLLFNWGSIPKDSLPGSIFTPPAPLNLLLPLFIWGETSLSVV